MQVLFTNEGITIANVGIWLNDPYKFFAWMVEIKFDLVARGTDGFITSELKLFDQIFVWVLCHTTTFIGIQKDVINVQGSGNKRFAVGRGCLYAGGTGTINFTDSEQTFVQWAKFDVDLDFVVLKSNQRKGKTWVATEPEL